MNNSLQVTRMANSIGDFFRASYDREAAPKGLPTPADDCQCDGTASSFAKLLIS
jgi:hypothetical protein